MKIFFYTLFFCFGGLLACNNATNEQGNGKDARVQNTITLDYQGQDLDTATFAGGCFWCTEAYFERVKGVKAVVSGYSGGTTSNPTYKEVSAGNTDYAEAVEIYYDPNIVTYQKLLQVFFATMDPTQLNRQGPDVGAQYRSVVFYHNQKQQNQAEEYIDQLSASGRYSKPIVTKLEPYRKFYVAENYHQDYYKLNPNDPYVRSVARPKVNKFEKEFQDLLKREYQN